jgi:hypothetical protein
MLVLHFQHNFLWHNCRLWLQNGQICAAKFNAREGTEDESPIDKESAGIGECPNYWLTMNGQTKISNKNKTHVF